MLPKKAIDEYKTLYKKRFGVELTDAEASFRAANLLKLYRAVLSPEPNGAVEDAGAERKKCHDDN